MPRPPTATPPPTLTIDFTNPTLLHRLHSGAGRGGALARAIGVKPGMEPVIDATAGLGRDAILLASLGLQVTMIERVQDVHAALARALEAALASGGEPARAAQNLTLLAGDARLLLPALSPATVLIDPMHPDRGNTALTRQPMRSLRSVVGPDTDAAELLAIALACARRRVVLKWPRHAAPLPGLRPPSHTIAGRTTRYDVFPTG